MISESLDNSFIDILKLQLKKMALNAPLIPAVPSSSFQQNR